MNPGPVSQMVLLDIEGTTSSISFVFDVMFPYVRRELSTFLEALVKDPSSPRSRSTRNAGEQMARDAGFESLQQATKATQASVVEWMKSEALSLMDRDVKATGLKELQGLIWEDGFQSGELKSHVYPDVAPRLRQWQRDGFDLQVYSSGSVGAQKLFFGHTQEGNLLSLFTAHYDTKVGSKKEAASYEKIARLAHRATEEVIFLSDSLPELEAASTSGMRTVWVKRPGNAEGDNSLGHLEIQTFTELDLHRV